MASISNSNVTNMITNAQHASLHARNLPHSTRMALLQSIQQAIQANASQIIEANKQDLAQAAQENLSAPLLARLKFDEQKIQDVCTMIDAVLAQENLLYKCIVKREIAPHLVLEKRYVPLGVVGFIFESRPDALVQMASLCLLTANGVIMKGGSEALRTNTVLCEMIHRATEHEIDGWIRLLHTRDEIALLLHGEQSVTGDSDTHVSKNTTVDLIIPRGSNEFVSYIMKHSQVPVLGHSDGVCHVYVHDDATIDMATQVILDAKLRYPAVCNAMECLVVHSKMLHALPDILHPLTEAHASCYADEQASAVLTQHDIDHTLADDSTWGVEYSDTIFSIKTVDSVDQAIHHINTFGSHHTDAIITSNQETAQYFQNRVDSSSVLWNCSTGFADGFRYGLGAEVGISTSKIHARGPMGSEGLLSTQWIVNGNGHTVSSFSDGTNYYTHKDLL